MTMMTERRLKLVLDEVSTPVLTGNKITGKEGNPVKVVLVDNTTGQVVKSGPESSAKVEILVLDASGDDNEHNWSLEDFNSRITREGDKTKPHFARSYYVYLKEGVAFLCDAKLGHVAKWTKECRCRLGARVMDNFRGIKVQEALTESFKVSDKRSTLYNKLYPPSLGDEVWRLENIGRGGARCNRLNENHISTVEDFLFLHSIDPRRLQQIVAVGGKIWKDTVDHALTCNKKLYLYYPSSEPKMGVVFDVVEGPKGVIDDSHYVPINDLSADQKDSARKLLLSAFENREDITPFEDEASLLHQFPRRSNGNAAITNSSIIPEACDLTVPENINGYDLTEPGTSSQTIINNGHDYHFSVPYQSTILQFPEHYYSENEGYLAIDPYIISIPDNPNNISQHVGSLGSTSTGYDNRFLGLSEHYYVENLADNERVIQPAPSPDHELECFAEKMSQFTPEMSMDLSEILRAQSHSHEESSAGGIPLVGAAAIMLSVVRARKRFMALVVGRIHVQKRQRMI